MDIESRLDIALSQPISEEQINFCFNQLEILLEDELAALAAAATGEPLSKDQKKARKQQMAVERLKKLSKWMDDLTANFKVDSIKRIKPMMHKSMEHIPIKTLKKMKTWAAKIMIPALESRKAMAINGREAKRLAWELEQLLELPPPSDDYIP